MGLRVEAERWVSQLRQRTLAWLSKDLEMDEHEVLNFTGGQWPDRNAWADSKQRDGYLKDVKR